MKLLYIFPHPDDESFGPAGVIDQQLKDGHEVYLLTLTRGGATKQRFKLNYTVEQMGEVRYKEMLKVADTLGLTGMTVLDFPDNRLKEIDPRKLEKAVSEHMMQVQPDIVVTYPVHGISGFHDHLVTHAVVKRVFLEMKEQGKAPLKRLAFLTLPDSGEPVFQDKGFRLKHSDEEDIDCVIKLTPENIEMFKKCLACYATYQDTIEESSVVEKIGSTVYFEFFGESLQPEVHSMTKGI